MYLIPGAVSSVPLAMFKAALLPPSEATVIVISVLVFLVFGLMFGGLSEVQAPHESLQIYTTRTQPTYEQNYSRII